MNLLLHLAKPVIAVHLRERVRERSDVVRVSVVNVALRVSVWCGSCTLHERPSAHRVWACEGGEQREDREDPRSWHRVEGEEGTRRGQREDCEDPSSWRGGTLAQ